MNLNEKVLLNDKEIATLSNKTRGGWTASWDKGYSSVSMNLTDASVIAGVLAAIYGGPVTGVIVAVASWLASYFADEAYYYYEYQYRNHNGMIQRRKYVIYYEDSSYSDDEILGEIYSKPQDVHTAD